MADTQVTPNALAGALSRSLGRAITAKAVRTMARSMLKPYDKVTHPAYQSHGYTPAQVKALTAAFRARATRTASAASVKVKARKVTTTTRKASPQVKSDAPVA